MKLLKCDERYESDVAINPNHLIKVHLEKPSLEMKEWVVLGELTYGRVILFASESYGECEEYFEHLCKMSF